MQQHQRRSRETYGEGQGRSWPEDRGYESQYGQGSQRAGYPDYNQEWQRSGQQESGRYGQASYQQPWYGQDEGYGQGGYRQPGYGGHAGYSQEWGSQPSGQAGYQGPRQDSYGQYPSGYGQSSSGYGQQGGYGGRAGLGGWTGGYQQGSYGGGSQQGAWYGQPDSGYRGQWPYEQRGGYRDYGAQGYRGSRSGPTWSTSGFQSGQPYAIDPFTRRGAYAEDDTEYGEWTSEAPQDQFRSQEGGWWQRLWRGRRGNAPRGYKRSDERVTEDVCERIMDAGLDAAEVDITVQSGVVTLSGDVRDRADKYRMEQIASDVSGVTDVQNSLRVRKGDTSGSAGRSGGSAGSGGTGGRQSEHSGQTGDRSQSQSTRRY